MAALTATAPRPITQKRMDTGNSPQYQTYSVADTLVLFSLALVAIYDGSVAGRPKGSIGPWSNGADEAFCGMFDSDVKTGVTDLSEKGKVQVDGIVLDQINIAGSAAARPGDPIFCPTDNVDDITLVPPTSSSKRIGRLYIKKVDDVIDTNWAVILDATQFATPANENDGPVNLITATVAQAAGVPAASPGRYHSITAAAAAAITIPVPTVAELGRTCYYARSGGAGVPTCSFTDELGLPVARVLADGEVLKLYAASVTGWRFLS